MTANERIETDQYRDQYKVSRGTQLLSRREAADLAGVHYNSIRGWEKSGALKTERTKVGGREEVRINRGDLEELLDRKGRRPRPSSELATERSAQRRGDPTPAALTSARERIVALEAENRVLREVLERYLDR
jgi:hypothetical protein